MAHIETGNEPPETRWYPVNEVASDIGVAIDTIYRWIERKKLPAHRIDDVVSHSAFVPETARRLSEPFFTKHLNISSASIRRFVQDQGHLLSEVLRGLDRDSKAALALIFMRGAGCRGDAAWVFRHPTVEDAVAKMLRHSPELLGIYLLGSDIDKLIDQITCGDVGLEHALVVPISLFTTIMTKLRAYTETKLAAMGRWWAHIDMFLSRRCDDEVLRLYVHEVPTMLERIVDPPLALETATEVNVAIRLFEARLLPDHYRKTFIQTIVHLRNRGRRCLCAVTSRDPSNSSETGII